MCNRPPPLARRWKKRSPPTFQRSFRSRWKTRRRRHRGTGTSTISTGRVNRVRGAAAVVRSEPAVLPPSSWSSWSVWSVAATFYLAAFYLRTSPAVMTTELMRDFAIKASQLGQFSAFYFYAYILMQIPTGILVDTWGARRLLIA